MGWHGATLAHGARWLESKGTNVGDGSGGVRLSPAGRCREEVREDGWKAERRRRMGLCRAAATLLVPRASPAPFTAPVSSFPFARSSQSNGSRRFPLRCRVSCLDDSSPPPELRLQALTDACHDAQPPAHRRAERRSCRPTGWLLLEPCASAPMERGQRRCALTVRSSTGAVWRLQEFVPPHPAPCRSTESHALCLSFPIYNIKRLLAPQRKHRAHLSISVCCLLWRRRFCASCRPGVSNSFSPSASSCLPRAECDSRAV